MLREEHLLAIVTSKSKERTDLILDRFQVFDFISCPQEGLKGKLAEQLREVALRVVIWRRERPREDALRLGEATVRKGNELATS